MSLLRRGRPTLYRSLSAPKIVDTTRKLALRVRERFPESSLSRVACEVQQTAEEAQARAEEFQQPIWSLRLVMGLLIVLIMAIAGLAVTQLRWGGELWDAGNFLQAAEAVVANTLFLSAAVVYLTSVERRIRRARVLSALHELRSLAHVIDMHQLDKAPERLLRGLAPTATSPERTMTQPQLCRYFDYCIELLSLLSKIAALYVQDFPDAETTRAVEQVEDLSSDLCRQIWQKIMALDVVRDRNEVTLADAPASDSTTRSSGESVAAQSDSAGANERATGEGGPRVRFSPADLNEGPDRTAP
ncbi:MAG TPA: hypothetical protein VGE52_06245 [Pirellulales bacterium]